MNVCLLSDSRGATPWEYAWIDKLTSEIRDVSFFIFRMSDEEKIVTLPKMEEFVLLKLHNVKIDLIVIQCGVHDGGILFWSEKTWKRALETSLRKFDKNYLINGIWHEEGKVYNYFNPQQEIEIFNNLKEKCPIVLFVGTMNMYPPNWQNFFIPLGKFYQKRNIEMLERIPKLATDSILFPQTHAFKCKYSLHKQDYLHFNDAGNIMLKDLIKEYIYKIKKSLNE